MKRLILALALLTVLTGRAEAVTRFYFPNTGATPIPVPSPIVGWEDVTQLERGTLITTKWGGTYAAGQTVTLLEDTADNHEIDRQYISWPLTAGTVFTGGVTTVSMNLTAREFAVSDDVVQGIVAVQIWNSTATTIRATLFSVSNHGTNTELLQTGLRNKTFSNAAAITASYTTVTGDILVVEIGFSTGADVANTTPEAAGGYGLGSTGDCIANQETDTDCAGWIEFSNTFTIEPTVTPTPTPTVTSTGTSTVTVTPTPVLDGESMHASQMIDFTTSSLFFVGAGGAAPGAPSEESFWITDRALSMLDVRIALVNPPGAGKQWNVTDGAPG